MNEPQSIVVPEPRRVRELTRAPISGMSPMDMIALAVQQGADLAKIEKLMDLRDRWEATEARKAFDAAVAEAKADIKPVRKNRAVDFPSKNGRTNYVYEDLAGIAAEVDPILAAHGLSYRFRAKQEGKRLTVTCVLSHRDGHYEENSLCAENDESGNKNGIQAIGSAATYLQRYTLKLALGLAAAKDDDGSAAGKAASDAQRERNKPPGYDKWCADMQAVADEGTEKLREAWNKSDAALRTAAAADGRWWPDLKLRAQSVDAKAKPDA